VTSSSVLKFIILINSENDLDVFDEEMSDEISFDTFSASEFLLDLS